MLTSFLLNKSAKEKSSSRIQEYKIFPSRCFSLSIIQILIGCQTPLATLFHDSIKLLNGRVVWIITFASKINCYEVSYINVSHFNQKWESLFSNFLIYYILISKILRNINEVKCVYIIFYRILSYFHCMKLIIFHCCERYFHIFRIFTSLLSDYFLRIFRSINIKTWFMLTSLERKLSYFNHEKYVFPYHSVRIYPVYIETTWISFIYFVLNSEYEYTIIIMPQYDYKQVVYFGSIIAVSILGRGGLMDKVSASQPGNRGFEPHTGHDHDTSTSWFQEADSRVI